MGLLHHIGKAATTVATDQVDYVKDSFRLSYMLARLAGIVLVIFGVGWFFAKCGQQRQPLGSEAQPGGSEAQPDGNEVEELACDRQDRWIAGIATAAGVALLLGVQIKLMADHPRAAAESYIAGAVFGHH